MVCLLANPQLVCFNAYDMTWTCQTVKLFYGWRRKVPAVNMGLSATFFNCFTGLLFIFATLTCSDSQEASTVPWYENLPAVAMDYKVHIDPGKEDCYFQYVNPGATFYVSFQVLRGGDGMAGFAVRHPTGQLVHPYQWKPNGEYQDASSPGGYYSVCIDNQFSRFASKLINIYMTVVRYDLWDKYTKEVEELNVNMENFTSTIVTVERNINSMFQYQHHSRGREARDFNLLLDNNSYIVRWSIIQFVVIVATTSLQVYFVRKLFDVKTGGSGGRSRI